VKQKHSRLYRPNNFESDFMNYNILVFTALFFVSLQAMETGRATDQPIHNDFVVAPLQLKRDETSDKRRCILFQKQSNDPNNYKLVGCIDVEKEKFDQRNDGHEFTTKMHDNTIVKAVKISRENLRKLLSRNETGWKIVPLISFGNNNQVYPYTILEQLNGIYHRVAGCEVEKNVFDQYKNGDRLEITLPNQQSKVAVTKISRDGLRSHIILFESEEEQAVQEFLRAVRPKMIRLAKNLTLCAIFLCMHYFGS
jgi:hypothetical protein